MDNAVIDVATAHVHEAIRALLADEVPDLAQRKGLAIFNDPYLHLSYESFKSYIHFIVMTWSGVAISFRHLLGRQIQIVDFVALVFFSTLVSAVLTMGVFMCLVCKLPFVESVFGIYSRLNGGFSATNSLNTRIFSSLTKREVRFSKAALASTSPGSPDGKDFNLEIAKMLLLLASVVYERTSDGIRESLKHTHSVPKVTHHKRKGSNGSPKYRTSPSATPLSPISPLASVHVFGGRAPGAFSQFQSQMSHHIHHHRPSHLLKTFGHKSAQQIRALLHGSEGDNVITSLVERLGLEYEPCSELNSASSSYAALFWDKKMNWVVVAFKGTSPAEFDEWLTDFDITRVDAGHRLPGYQQVHRGFKNRLFPDQGTSHRTPYETIIAALKVVTNDLMSRTDKDINVWFTGHSLGCAMATFTYTRALLNLDGLHPRVQLCDAYLYGAPVVCDMASAKVFNEFMEHRRSITGRVRNVWRVTNRSDAVSTLLPMLGDDPLYPHTTSLFAYAHLGSEVKMRPGSGKSIIVDNYCTPAPLASSTTSGSRYGGFKARVVSLADGSARHWLQEDDETLFAPSSDSDSDGERKIGGRHRGRARGGSGGDEFIGYAMTDEARSTYRAAMNALASARTGESGSKKMSERERKLRKRREEAKYGVGVPWWIAALEYVPLFGRIVSHFPGLYFRSLQEMAPGDFVWRRS